MLQCLQPEDRGNDPAELAIGERDRLLIGLRERIFGPALNAFAVCPGCGVNLEFSLKTYDLLKQCPGADEGQARVIDIAAGDYKVSFRRPTSADLAAAAEAESPDGGRAVLLERCVESATRGGVPLGSGKIPEEIIGELEERLASADPGGEILLSLVCPACRYAWTVDFDIAAYLYAEISALSRQLLDEVGVLAAAYGWSEEDILAMPRLRRRFYLDRVR
ncbi:MAG: hypothetical protein OEW05_05300 [Candidatus Aminicenantes bacterium]|nr:hypothetical protein [Candidatus Aminicenantes bacterium]